MNNGDSPFESLIYGGFIMQTLRFEDRDWLTRDYVRDDNGRLIARDEYEAKAELREVLALHNGAPQAKTAKNVINATLLGGLIWAVMVLLNGMG